MHRLIPFAAAAFALAVLAGLDNYRAADKDAPKNSIQDVMQQAHKGGLLKKVTEGKGSKQDKADLLEMYTDLAKNKPPKGDEKSWKAKTDPIVAAAKAVVAGDKGAEAKLKKAVDCMACHSVHKP